MSRTPVNTDRVAAPLGPFSVATRGAPSLFLSGQLAQDRTTGELVGHDAATQVRQVAALSLPAASVREAWFAGVGVPFAFCHLTSATEVDAALLDKAAWTTAFDRAWARNVYFFSGELEDGADLYARMFAPALGIDEDPATGSASAALAACVAERDGRMDAQIRLTIRQGVLMDRPSVITAGACVEGGRLRDVTVGGEVVVVGTGALDVRSPPPPAVSAA
jgi:PhzF family phenazine biosynthesis protein